MMSTTASALEKNAIHMGKEVSKRNSRFWTGWILSALPALFLLSSGVNLARSAPFVLDGFAHLGYGQSLAFGIGVAEFLCATLYLIPRTAFFGALFTTAYLGGATASHVRVGDVFVGPVIVCVVMWVGLALRDKRLSNYILGILSKRRRNK
jgi:DoxX-like family